ncbi:MAG: DUF1573 domain-containing protein [Lewinellaceae bacterium]|nr:DUF1573 domain-containing protein [Lewinellaceae bacterium]
MKYLLFLLTFGLFSACTTAQKVQENATVSAPVVAQPTFVSWDKTMIELGAVKKGEKRQMDYTFTNTSGESIQIDIVDACDCTKVEFPRGVLQPGATGKLDVSFDSSEKEESETIEVRGIFKTTTNVGTQRSN